jgi:DNA-directed RNA polymerase subunit RPC12/RpoP
MPESLTTSLDYCTHCQHPFKTYQFLASVIALNDGYKKACPYCGHKMNGRFECFYISEPLGEEEQAREMAAHQQ